jgi:hypothetical protein
MGIKETISSNAAAAAAAAAAAPNDEFDVGVTSSSPKANHFNVDDESISNEMKIWLFVIFIFVHVIIIGYIQWFVIPKKTATPSSSLSFSLSNNDDNDNNNNNNNNEEGKDNKKKN